MIGVQGPGNVKCACPLILLLPLTKHGRNQVSTKWQKGTSSYNSDPAQVLTVQAKRAQTCDCRPMKNKTHGESNDKTPTLNKIFHKNKQTKTPQEIGRKDESASSQNYLTCATIHSYTERRWNIITYFLITRGKKEKQIILVCST